MKVSREQAAENRERVIEVAGRLFREKGFDGIGVADIMKGAGLTHGGFYGHFASKDDLAAEACAQMLDRSVALARLAAGEAPLTAILTSDLLPRHRDAPGSGCAMSALAAEAVRQPAPIRAIFTKGLRDFIEVLTTFVAGRSAAARREKASATMSGMVGAMVLARAANDPEFSAEILRAGAKAFGSAAA